MVAFSATANQKVIYLNATQVSTIGSFLKREVACIETFGYETKYKREILGLKKTHYNDAICVGIEEKQSIQLTCTLLKKVRIANGDYQLRWWDPRSEKDFLAGKTMGIRKFDKVVSKADFTIEKMEVDIDLLHVMVVSKPNSK